MKKMFFLVLIIFSGFFIKAQEVSLSNYQIDIVLSLHNFYRNTLGYNNVQWSSDLASKAEDWLVIYDNNPLITYNSYGYKQNVYFSGDTNVIKAVRSWAKEQMFYYPNADDYDKLLFQHYYNIINPNMKYIGCAMRKSKSGLYVFVCFYSE